LRQNVWFCDPNKVGVTFGVFDTDVFDYGDQVNRQARINAFTNIYFTHLSPDWFNQTVASLRIVPPEALWAERMNTDGNVGFEGLNLRLCFESISFPKYYNRKGHLEIDSQFTLQTQAQFGGKSDWVPVARAVYSGVLRADGVTIQYTGCDFQCCSKSLAR
jgi:hypothetical protein